MASEHDVALILNEWKERRSTIDLHIELPSFSAYFVGEIHRLTLPPPGTPTTPDNRRIGLHDDHGNWIEVPLLPENWSTFSPTEEITNHIVRDDYRRRGILSCLQLTYPEDGRITLAELNRDRAET